MNKPNQQKQTHRYREQSSDSKRGRGGGEGDMDKGNQLYGDGWKLFGGEHTAVCTVVHRNIMLYTQN